MSKFWQRPTHTVVCSETRKMKEPVCSLINPQLLPAVERRLASTNGFGAGHKPLHLRLSSYSGLKPAVNQRAVSKSFRFLVILLALSLVKIAFAELTQNAEFEAVAEEYVKTYLAANPLEGTALGLHEY